MVRPASHALTGLSLTEHMAYRAGQCRGMRAAHLHLARIYSGEARRLAVVSARAAHREMRAYLEMVRGAA